MTEPHVVSRQAKYSIPRSTCTMSGLHTIMPVSVAYHHALHWLQVWVGLGPGAIAAFLQTLGQKSVPPAQAQVRP